MRWRLTSSFPRQLDTIFGTAQTFAQYIAEATDNKFQIQTFPAGEIVGGLQAWMPCRAAPSSAARRRVYFYIGKEPTFGIRHRPAVQPQCPPAAFLVAFRRRQGDHRRASSPATTASATSCGQSGCQMGGFFRKELQSVDDLQRPEVPHRRARRPGAGEARRHAAADRRRRRLPGARARHHRRRRVRRPLRRREARALQGREILLRARLVGGRRDAPPPRQPAANGPSCRRATRRSPCRPARRRTTGCSRNTMP